MRLVFAYFLFLISLVAGNSATCGKTQYSSDALNKAADAACALLKKGTTVGRNNYPHEYKNFEKIKLTGSAPWYEFPVLSNGQVYNGAAPGPDRVIITKDCKQAGAITHTGASGNNFVTCDVKTSGAPAAAVNQHIVAFCSTLMIYMIFP
ncbi:general substrate transporter [Pochonia chlamydosporia 170]|uniref:ribonuclease T1 n=1 Tax=Pochonia chlamydosporia 170 TaxID=1380566 RepID=A0A179G0F9_METCM|nr:general substrate transporter [Pochonia chlamydosporia 170]OAQ70958.1 general substrate transporter [Pochonia chlamydosporia 170]